MSTPAPGIQINYDKEALTKAVLDALANSTVGNLITHTIKAFVIKPEEVERQYRWAVDEVVKKVFFDMLSNDPEFKKRVKKMITETLTEGVVKDSIAALEKRIRNY